MLDFAFTPEQETFRRTMRRLALEELLPRYAHGDRHREFPAWQRRRIYETIGAPVPQDFILAGIATEEVARGDFTCGFFAATPFRDQPLLDALPAPLQETYAQPIRRGEKLLALALTESEAGSDLAMVRTAAVRDGDEYVLSGEKNSVSYLNAALFFIFARFGGLEARHKGIRIFAVPRETPGLSLHAFEDLGNRAIPRGQLFLDHARVPASHLLPLGEVAFKMLRTYLNTNKAIIGLMCLGAALQTLDETVAYVKQRRAFGQPISRFEGVAFPLVEAWTRLEAARLCCYRVLWMRQQGLPHIAEGAMVKWWVPRLCADIIQDCLVLHGHYGYNEELPLAQRLRDVIGWQIGDGTPQIQKVILARKLLGRAFSPLA